MTTRKISSISGHVRIDGVVPGVRGQRAFPTPERAILDPFVMLDHIGPEKLADDFYVDGVMHPHRGFETLTIMLEGVMHHLDSSGFREDLHSGSTQNMRAGRGIQHGGDMAADPETQVFHEVQLWVTTPAAQKMKPAEIRSAERNDKPIIERDTYSVEVITGSMDGQSSPLSTTQPTRVLRVEASFDGPVTVGDIPESWSALIYVLGGVVSVGDTTVEEFHSIAYERGGDTISFHASEGAEVLVLTGEPTDEPIAMGGPWVMNTREELAQANADFAAGLI